ncbi:hypothetical protein [Actibacterium sp. 188UL27-1]|uniref:hypothetical protein n=1 Tax=Actibacterium sp. 188UL27-1 TaxID=2786961 RepID=UPI001958D236|nr:hypothetical protein [Actibacterium sp. 188UL27-1]
MDRMMPGINTQIEDNDAFLMAMGQGSTINIHAADAAKETCHSYAAQPNKATPSCV